MLIGEGGVVALLDVARVSYFRDLEEGDQQNLHVGDEDENGRAFQR